MDPSFDTLNGDAGDDRLWGDDGHDTLLGGEGNDVLQGGAGAELLVGGPGADLLQGGLGADLFVLQHVWESGPYADSCDQVMDFVRGEDRIDLADIDADADTETPDAFTALIDAAAAFTAPGQLRFADGVLYGNTDGDADPEFSIALLGVSALDLSDLVLAH